MWRLAVFVAVTAAPALVVAHSGGLNAEGCHNNRKTGDYHCHRASSSAVPQSPVPQPPPVERQGKGSYVAPSGAADASSPTVNRRPTCYVGPRGGTYTITSSGLKNYSGC